jgi:hypothetical protein
VIAKPAANSGGLHDRFVAIRDLGLMVLPSVQPGSSRALPSAIPPANLPGSATWLGLFAATGAGAGLAYASRITLR